MREYNARELYNILKTYYREVSILGLWGTPEVQEFEKIRVRQSPIKVYAKMCLPQLIQKIKELFLVKVARKVGKRELQQNESQNNNNPIAWEEKYSISDFNIIKQTRDCIDLIGICRK